MTHPPIPDQLIPTLNDVVPLEGATSISKDDLLMEAQNSLQKIATSLNQATAGAPVEDFPHQIADQVLAIVSAKLVKILPDMMREAVDEVLIREMEIGNSVNTNRKKQLD